MFKGLNFFSFVFYNQEASCLPTYTLYATGITNTSAKIEKLIIEEVETMSDFDFICPIMPPA